MPKRKTRIFEGTDDGEDNPWKVLESYHVFYGPGFHAVFKINKPDREGLTEERVLFMIQKHRGDKRPAEAEGGGGGKGKRARAEAAANAAEAEEGGFAADSQTHDRKIADYMNLDGPQRDYSAARETTKRNKLASVKAAEEVAELRRDHAQLLRLWERLESQPWA